MPTEEERVHQIYQHVKEVLEVHLRLFGPQDKPFREKQLDVIRAVDPNFTGAGVSDEALQGRFELAVERLANSAINDRKI